MSFCLPQPLTCKYIDRYGSSHLSIGSCCVNGYREYMEDEYVVKLWEDGRFFIGVFDGHCGNECSKYLKATFPTRLETVPPNPTKESFIELALDIDKSFTDINDKDGSVATYIYGCHDTYDDNIHMMVGNVGDSRTLKIDNNGVSNCITTDHKPSTHEECVRITKDGGFVKNGRVNGNLAISRAFGDKIYKKNTSQLDCKVIAKPDIYPMKITNGSNEILILISDGIYDTGFNNDLICSIVKSELRNTDDLGYIAAVICDVALDYGSTDNMTCLIIKTFTNGIDYINKFGTELFIPCQEFLTIENGGPFDITNINIHKQRLNKFNLGYLKMAQKYKLYRPINNLETLMKIIKKKRETYLKLITLNDIELELFFNKCKNNELTKYDIYIMKKLIELDNARESDKDDKDDKDNKDDNYVVNEQKLH